MALKETLTADMKTAMKAREKERTQTVRMLLAALKTLEIDQTIDEKVELEFLSREAKKRREAIEAYDKAGRDELAAKERAELVVIEAYLPQQLSREEVVAIVTAAVAETGATSMRDMGKVMKIVMPKVKGRFPGKEVKPIVDAAING